MAITADLTLTDNFGEAITFPRAYVRVTQVSGGKAGMSAQYLVATEKDGRFLSQGGFDFTPDLAPDAPNFITQAYSRLKTFPQFADATDC